MVQFVLNGQPTATFCVQKLGLITFHIFNHSCIWPKGNSKEKLAGLTIKLMAWLATIPCRIVWKVGGREQTTVREYSKVIKMFPFIY